MYNMLQSAFSTQQAAKSVCDCGNGCMSQCGPTSSKCMLSITSPTWGEAVAKVPACTTLDMTWPLWASPCWASWVQDRASGPSWAKLCWRFARPCCPHSQAGPSCACSASKRGQVTPCCGAQVGATWPELGASYAQDEWAPCSAN